MSKIGSGQRAALFEAFQSTVSLIPEDLRGSLVLVGGTALLSIGGDRKTEDVDFAVTAPALYAFQEAAVKDSRFKKAPGGDWEYESANGIMIPLEFIIQGGPFMPIIQEVKEFGSNGGVRAELGELALMKAKSVAGRGEDKDEEDFRFLIEKMREEGKDFKHMVLAPADGEEFADAQTLLNAARKSGQRYVNLVRGMLPA